MVDTLSVELQNIILADDLSQFIGSCEGIDIRIFEEVKNLVKTAEENKELVQGNEEHYYNMDGERITLYSCGVLTSRVGNQSTIGVFKLNPDIQAKKIDIKHIKFYDYVSYSTLDEGCEPEVLTGSIFRGDLDTKVLFYLGFDYRPETKTYFTYGPYVSWEWYNDEIPLLTPFGEIMEQAQPPVSRKDIYYEYDEMSFDYSSEMSLQRKRVFFAFLKNGACVMETDENSLSVKAWGVYFMKDNHIEIKLMEKDQFRVGEITIKENLPLENSELKYSGYTLKQIDPFNPVLNAKQNELINLYFKIEQFSLCSINGLKSLLQSAIPTGKSKKYSYSKSEGCDSRLIDLIFSEDGTVYVSSFLGTDNYDVDTKYLGIYFIKPNNQISLLLFEATKDNKMLPESIDLNGSLDDSTLDWYNQICIEINN